MIYFRLFLTILLYQMYYEIYNENNIYFLITKYIINKEGKIIN